MLTNLVGYVTRIPYACLINKLVKFLKNFFMKAIIKREEISGFEVLPYDGHENHAPAHPDVIAFVALMLGKGYSKEELIVAWGQCQGIKLEAQEQGNEEKFEGERFNAKFEGELTLLRAVCCLFRHLNTADMELYFFSWLDTIRNAQVPAAE